MGAGDMGLTDYLRGLGRPVAYYPALRAITGSTTATLFLCQLIYWDGKGDDPDGWVYKTQAEFEAELGLSRYEQEEARKKLVTRKLIEEKRAGQPARMYYRVNTEALNAAWEAHSSMGKSRILECGKPANQNGEIPHSLTYTETTTETTTGVSADAEPPQIDVLVISKRTGKPVELPQEYPPVPGLPDGSLPADLDPDTPHGMAMAFLAFYGKVEADVSPRYVAELRRHMKSLSEQGFTCERVGRYLLYRRAAKRPPANPRYLIHDISQWQLEGEPGAAIVPPAGQAKRPAGEPGYDADEIRTSLLAKLERQAAGGREAR